MTNRKNLEMLHRLRRGASPRASRKRVELRFLASPVEIQGDGKVERIVVGDQRALRRRRRRRPRRATPARPRRSSAGSSCARSATSAPPIDGVPHDARSGVIPNKLGRVVDETAAVPGALRGRLDQARPERRDRHEQEGRPGDRRRAARGRRPPAAARAREPGPPTPSRRCSRERGVDFVEFDGWRAIDALEQSLGEPLGRPRVKLTASRRCSKYRHLLRFASGGAGLRAPTPWESLSDGIDLSELKGLIEAALPGATVEVVDEGGGDHLAVDRHRAAVRGPEPDRPAPPRQVRRQRADGRRHDPRAFDPVALANLGSRTI